MQTDPYSWSLADWLTFFERDGYSPDEARDLAVEAIDWHAEARESGGEGPNDTDPSYFWIGFAC